MSPAEIDPGNRVWTLILDKIPLRGSWNMAADEFLFKGLSEEPRTYLRFYTWERPTVSLGYSQKAANVLDVPFCKAKGMDIVRRITGGKLVLHDKEVTYSVCSSDTESFSTTLSQSYRLISEALMKGLERIGLKPHLAESAPPSYSRSALPCFSHSSRNEINVNGKKIVGSAQKRVGSKFIQHGSIPLEEDEDLLRSVAFLKNSQGDVSLTSLSRELGKKVDAAWVMDCLASGVTEYFRVRFNLKEFNEEEKAAIRKIQKERYENPGWTFPDILSSPVDFLETQ